MAGIKTLGNHGLAYLLTKGTEISGAATDSPVLTEGSWYYVSAKAAEGSVMPVRVGLPFQAASAISMSVAGDKCVPLTKHLLGFARGKSLSQSKQTTDATTDSNNGIAQQLSDGIVATTGSISGYNEIPAENSAQEMIIKMFQTYARDNAGTVEVTEVSTPISLLMIDWTARRISAAGPSDGEACEIDIMPVIFTSKNTDSDYGSVKGFNCDFVAQQSDDDGFEPLHWVGVYNIAAS
jgi:hypothetical protein